MRIVLRCWKGGRWKPCLFSAYLAWLNLIYLARAHGVQQLRAGDRSRLSPSWPHGLIGLWNPWVKGQPPCPSLSHLSDVYPGRFFFLFLPSMERTICWLGFQKNFEKYQFPFVEWGVCEGVGARRTEGGRRAWPKTKPVFSGILE